VTLAHSRTSDDEPPVVEAARAFHAGVGSPAAVLDALRRSVVYAQQSGTAGPAAKVIVYEGWGMWIAVYTSKDRLLAHVGPCRWWSTVGSDLLDNILPELVARTGLAGVVVDLDSPHAFPVPGVTAAARRTARPAPTAGDREFEGRWSR
jgi:hypothetical protein